MTNQVNTYLKFAHIQMAAEALYGKRPESGSGVTFSGVINKDVLIAGNNRPSIFPDTLAAEFVTQWEVVEHVANTSTGFSGTLFRARKSDPATGIVEGELVLSFRSTEIKGSVSFNC